MRHIFTSGAVSKADVAGYARELPPLADTDAETVEAFMTSLRPILPNVHAALVARHRRVVSGVAMIERSETERAKALYRLGASGAWRRLSNDCEAGYAALRRWIADR